MMIAIMAAVMLVQVLYAYRPCDLAVLALDELRARGFDSGFLDTRRVLVDEIESGSDDLGVLVMGSAALASPSSTEQHYAHW
jgi:homospermidine synthase